MTEKVIIEEKTPLTELERHALDFTTLEEINEQLNLTLDFINSNRGNCVDGTQPVLNIIGSVLREAQIQLQARGIRVKSDYEKLDILEEAEKRLESRLRRSKK